MREWLARCTAMELLTPGPVAVGSKLRYAFKDAGMKGVMAGSVTVHEPNARLGLHFEDFTRLLSPLVRRRLPRQTIAAVEALKALAERGAA